VRGPQHGGIFFRLLVLVMLFVFAAFLYLMRGPLLHLTGQLWVTTDPPEHSDAIIVLGDDNYRGDRAAHAADLYQTGVAPLVVASGRLLRPNAGLAELIGHDLESHGVPAASIVKFPHRASDTEEEAEALSGLVNSRGWKRVLIVTSDYHARRTRSMIMNSIRHIGGRREPGKNFSCMKCWATSWHGGTCATNRADRQAQSSSSKPFDSPARRS
jgi:uncharacterized SAM-binding protein YcdF (DUF218 family)